MEHDTKLVTAVETVLGGVGVISEECYIDSIDAIAELSGRDSDDDQLWMEVDDILSHTPVPLDQSEIIT